jgi:hypothetical protein
MCEQMTIHKITTGALQRHGENLVLRVVNMCECHDCGEISRITADVYLPCSIVRNLGAAGAKEYVGKGFASTLGDSFGPISYQMFCEKVMDAFSQADLVNLAGQPFLLDMVPLGHC